MLFRSASGQNANAPEIHNTASLRPRMTGAVAMIMMKLTLSPTKPKAAALMKRIPPVRAAYRRGGRAAMLHS